MSRNALFYLLATKLKNNLKEFIRKPARLVFALFLIAMFGLTIFGASQGVKNPERQLRDFSELSAIISAILILMFSISFYTGLSQGGSIFKMPDVNFIFPSPINKRSVMFFGLIQQIGASLLVGVFIMFQYTNLHINYGIGIGGLLLIFLVYSLTVFLGQTSAMLLYIFISDSDRKRTIAKNIFIAYIIFLCGIIGFQVFKNQDDMLNVLVSAGNGLLLRSFPFAGWMAGFAHGVFRGEYLQAALWLGLSILAFLAMLSVMSRSNREYYEDVLASTETAFNALSTAKEGSGTAPMPQKIKVGKSGLGKGQGASVLFFKHILEKRRSKSFILSPSEIIFALVIIVFSFFMKSSGIIPIIAFSSYMMVFSITTGRFNLELMKPYIYLIPEPPLKKLFFSISEMFPSALLEAFIIFIPVGFILELSAFETALCVITRVSFGFLFTGGIIIVERIWGGSLSKMAGLMLYLLVDIIIVMPAVALAIYAAFSGLNLLSPTAAILIPLGVGNVLTALVILFICRNMLQYAET